MSDETKQSMCDGKVPFGDCGLATAVAARMRRNRNEPVVVYRCPYCHCWHLGKRRTKQRHQKRLDRGH